MTRWAWSFLLAAATLVAACDTATSTAGDGGDDAGEASHDGGRLDGSRDAAAAADARVICQTAADCDDDAFCNGAETCAPASADADVHGCVPGASPCTAPMVCSESADACTTSCGDGDHDGHTESSCGGDDCDDADASAHPGATEVCNGHDDDCDTRIDEGVSTTFYADADADGYGDDATSHAACAAATGEVASAGDCDDTDPAIHPSATEICDDRDQDCDGRTDEGVTTLSWPDGDGDGFGALGAPTTSCTAPAGNALRTGDCDDAAAAVHPMATELCDGIDDDCNGLLDGPNEDLDGDGAASRACGGFDCDDDNPSSSIGMPESCNGIDDDCDGGTDEGTLITSYRDADGDGYGVASAPTSACVVPAGYATMVGDCDDGNPAVSPAALESCNTRDDDCDTRTDEGVLLDTYRDTDGDGHGTGAAIRACTVAMGYASSGDDCDDTRVAIYPGAPDLCDRLDDDCVPGGASDDLDADGYLVVGATCSGGAYTSQPRTDCDDAIAAVHPGAAEVCNGRDDDCDGVSDGAPATAACAAANSFHATSTCGSGACTTACTSGWTDCDGSFNGCETRLTTSSTSCGTCGMACAPGQVCAASACSTRYQRQRSFGSYGWVHGVAFDTSGNVFVAGEASGSLDFGGTTPAAAGGWDAFVASYDASANLRWVRRYGGSFDERALSIAVDASGNVYVAGNTSNTNVGGATLAFGGFLASYTNAGAHRWSRNIGHDARAVVVDGSGNVTAAGMFQSSADFGGGAVSGQASSNLFVASYVSSSGAYRWARTYAGSNVYNTDTVREGSGGVGAGGATFFTVRSASQYVVSGTYHSGIVIGHSATGTLLWARGNVSAVTTDSVGNVYAAGTPDPAFVASPGLPYPSAINVYTSAGAFTRGIELSQNRIVGLAVDASNNLYAAGGTYAGAFAGSGTLPGNDIFFASFDGTGAPRWSFVAPSGVGSGTGTAVAARSGTLVLGFIWGGGVSGPMFGGPALSAGGLVWWTP